MNELPSTKFRATFHRLAEPTVVTVNGHAIGTWTPGVRPAAMIDLGSEATPIKVQTVREALAARDEEIAHLKRELARREAPIIGEANARARGGLRGITATHEGFVDRQTGEIAGMRRVSEPSFGAPSPAPKTRKAR